MPVIRKMSAVLINVPKLPRRRTACPIAKRCVATSFRIGRTLRCTLPVAIIFIILFGCIGTARGRLINTMRLLAKIRRNGGSDTASQIGQINVLYTYASFSFQTRCNMNYFRYLTEITGSCPCNYVRKIIELYMRFEIRFFYLGLIFINTRIYFAKPIIRGQNAVHKGMWLRYAPAPRKHLK